MILIETDGIVRRFCWIPVLVFRRILIWTCRSEGFLTQELEPGVYSIDFGDQRLLEGRIQDIMQRCMPDVPLLKRIVEYRHPEHLRSPSLMNSSQNTLDSACHQVWRHLQITSSLMLCSNDNPMLGSPL